MSLTPVSVHFFPPVRPLHAKALKIAKLKKNTLPGAHKDSKSNRQGCRVSGGKLPYWNASACTCLCQSEGYPLDVFGSVVPRLRS